MRKLISIDSSTKKTGMGVFIDGTYEKYFFLDFSKEKEMEKRLELMSVKIWEVLDQELPNIIYIEDTVVTRNAYTQRTLTMLQGVIFSWCIKHNCEFKSIRPTRWRKLLEFEQGKNVKRQELKNQSISYVKKHYEIDTNDDIADAICIGAAASKICVEEDKKNAR